MKFKSCTRFSMQAQGDSAEILIYEEIGDSFWGGGVNPKQFAADLKALGDVKTLNVRLNSPGGDVFDGVTIYNQLAQHPAAVNVYIDGLAASIASVIAMAGEKICIADNAMMMIHNAWAGTVGDANDMRKMADILDKVNTNVAGTYSKRSGQSNSAVLKLMANETWMTGQEAVDEGFADEIMQSSKSDSASARFDLSHFKNAPKSATERFAQQAQAVATSELTSPPSFYHARLKLYERTLNRS
jgi:ATP-dependent protease ClpP protease subunit